MKAVSLLLFLASFAYAAEPEKRGFAGGISSIDEISHVHITNLLLAHGIESVMWGSLIHSIEVPPAKEAEALRLIREDAPKRGYTVWFAKDDVAGTPTKSKERLRCIPLKEALKQPDYSNKTPLGRFLRSKEISKFTAKYSFIASLEVAERQYLTTPKTLGTAYQIELRIRNTTGKRGKEYSGTYQALDNGRNIQFMGSGEGDFTDD